MMARVAALVSPRVTLEAVDIASQLHETIVKKTKIIAVLRIRNVYPGSVFFPSRIRIKEFKYFNQKNCF
jgi:hypothetical protein